MSVKFPFYKTRAIILQYTRTEMHMHDVVSRLHKLWDDEMAKVAAQARPPASILTTPPAADAALQRLADVYGITPEPVESS